MSENNYEFQQWVHRDRSEYVISWEDFHANKNKAIELFVPLDQGRSFVTKYDMEKLLKEFRELTT